MEYSCEHSVQHALLLDSDDISAINRVLVDEYGPTDFSVTCAGGFKFSTDSIDELLQYENNEFRKIERIDIHAGDPTSGGCTVSIKHGFASSTVIAVRDPNEKRMLKVLNELPKRFEECRPAYWLLTTIRARVLVALVIAIPMALLIYKMTDILSHPPAQISASDARSLAYIIVIFLLVGWWQSVDRRWMWLFPMLWFKIGRQEDALVKREKWRNWIFKTVIGGLVLAVVGNLLTLMVTKT